MLSDDNSDPGQHFPSPQINHDHSPRPAVTCPNHSQVFLETLQVLARANCPVPDVTKDDC